MTRTDRRGIPILDGTEWRQPSQRSAFRRGLAQTFTPPNPAG